MIIEPEMIEKIVNDNIRIVQIIANNYRRESNEYDENEDIFQVGLLALFKSIKNFDGNRGVHFLSYASQVINGDIKKYLRDNTRLIKLSREIHDLDMSIASLRKSNYTKEEILKTLKISESKYDEVMNSKFMTVSLDMKYEINHGEGEEDTLYNFIEGGEFEKELITNDYYRKLFGVLKDIYPYGYVLCRLRMVDISFREIAEMHKVSTSSISRRMYKTRMILKAIDKYFDDELTLENVKYVYDNLLESNSYKITEERGNVLIEECLQKNYN